MVRLLIETNNTPFDFVEGESELVSGFNVEYGGVLFSLIFIIEYNRILFIAILTSLFFFSREGVNYINFLVSRILVFF